MNKNKKTFVMLIFLGIVLFFVFLYLVFSTLSSNTTLTGVSPTPSKDLTTVSPSPPKDLSEEYEKEEEPEKILEILSLRKITPYYGRFFILAFVEKEGQFFVYIDPNNKTEGNAEFDQFLRQNGIPDRSYFPGLVATDKTIPQP